MRHRILTARLKRWLSLLFKKIAVTATRIATRRQSKQKQQLSNAEYHLSLAELRRLASFAGTRRDKLLIQLLIETGVRRSEVSVLKVGDVDSLRGVIVIKNSKGNKSRVVPVTLDLARALKTLNADSLGHIFLSRNGAFISCRQINRIVAAAGRTAGIRNPNPRSETVTCHLLRHSFARHWKASGGSIESLSKILGHSSVKTTWDQYGTESLADVVRNYQKTIKKIRKMAEL